MVKFINEDKLPQNIKDKIDFLNKATVAYDKGQPFISDEEYDKLYFEVSDWQSKHGILFADAPDQSIYFEEVSKLEKVEHNHSLLSLRKTKDLNEIKVFCGDKMCIAMLKMDGLTCSLYYENGKLVKAETRGNGYIGEDITHNAMVIPSIPKTIFYLKPLTVDGEIICKYDDFEPFAAQYKNPRNFAAGSIRLLSAEESYNRHLTFVAWDSFDINYGVTYEDPTVVVPSYLELKLHELKRFGFTTVPKRIIPNQGSVEESIEYLKNKAKELNYPIDGIVFKYNYCPYYDSLGTTSHHPLGAMAYKFYDEAYETTLRDIEWTMGRTGVLTPVAVFDEVDTGDAKITRANLHNISIMEDLGLDCWYNGLGIEIFQANMVIPQVKRILPNQPIGPKFPFETIICPFCGGATEIKQENNSKQLYCINPDCPSKLINKLDHFLGSKGLDIKGISKATLEKLINWGWVEKIEDLFNLEQYRDEWTRKEGFGPRSVDKILDSINAGRNTTFEKFLSAIGIPLIGQNQSKYLSQKLNTYESLREKVDERFDFSQYNGFAEAKTNSLLNFDYTEADNIYKYLTISAPEQSTEIEQNSPIAGKVFAITGSVHHFKNRDELKAFINAHGGKVVNSISGNTNYLINNDINSTSSKNITAKQRGISIIDEDTLLSMI